MNLNLIVSDLFLRLSYNKAQASNKIEWVVICFQVLYFYG